MSESPEPIMLPILDGAESEIELRDGTVVRFRVHDEDGRMCVLWHVEYPDGEELFEGVRKPWDWAVAARKLEELRLHEEAEPDN